MNKSVILAGLLIIVYYLNIGIAAAQQTVELLTNEKIVKMVKAGIGDDVIIEKIHHSSSDFDIGTEKLIEMKNQGVSDGVLKAMMTAARKNNSNQSASEKRNNDNSQSTSTQANQSNKTVNRPQLTNKPRQGGKLVNTPKIYSGNPPEAKTDNSTGKPDNLIQMTEDGLPVGTDSKPAAAIFRIKYRRFEYFSELSKKEDLCEGILTVGQTLIRLNFYGGKSFQKRDCPTETFEIRKDKFLELKDSSREKWYGNSLFSDYVYIRAAITDEKNENKDKIKEFLIYPTEAAVVLGTKRQTLTGVVTCSNCSAIVCRNCNEKLDEMKTLLQKLAITSSIKIGGMKVKTGKN